MIAWWVAIIAGAWWLSDEFGTQPWLEKYFGSTRGGYIAIGSWVIILGVFVMFGVVGGAGGQLKLPESSM